MVQHFILQERLKIKRITWYRDIQNINKMKGYAPLDECRPAAVPEAIDSELYIAEGSCKL